MFRTLVKTDAVSVENKTVPVRYFEVRTLRGARPASRLPCRGGRQRVYALPAGGVVHAAAGGARFDVRAA